MKTFLITARTPLLRITFRAKAKSSGHAATRTADLFGTLFGDQPCGITVVVEAPHGDR